MNDHVWHAWSWHAQDAAQQVSCENCYAHLQRGNARPLRIMSLLGGVVTREETFFACSQACYDALLARFDLTPRPPRPTRKRATVQHRCEAPDCGTWTTGAALVGGYEIHYLCDAHRTRETLEPLVYVGDAWEGA